MKLSDIKKLTEAPTPPQGDTDEAIVLDYRERIKALQDIQSDTEILRDPDLKRAVMVGRAFLAKWKDAWIADDPDRESLFQRWARESVEDEVEESSPAPDGPDYKKGDLIVAQNGRSYVLDEYDDGIWWAVGDDGDEYEFEPGTELHHEPGWLPESEDNSVVSALDTMRTHLHDYEHDPSDRWEKYKQYRDQRKQISKRAKNVTEWGDTDILSKKDVEVHGRRNLKGQPEEISNILLKYMDQGLTDVDIFKQNDVPDEVTPEGLANVRLIWMKNQKS